MSKEKQAILKQLFMLFDRFSDEMDRACIEGCAACCTRNVTLTSLEAKYILDGLNSYEKDAVLSRIANEHHKNRMVPKITINELAKLCMAGEEPPEEFADPLWGACPLLSNQRCMVYDLRPLACRAMTSKKRCNVTGFAEMDEYMVSLAMSLCSILNILIMAVILATFPICFYLREIRKNMVHQSLLKIFL
jgi:Fe-S-cluster containining protein